MTPLETHLFLAVLLLFAGFALFAEWHQDKIRKEREAAQLRKERRNNYKKQ